MTVSQAQFTAHALTPQQPAPIGLQNPDGTQAAKRFDVYRNNVAVGLTEALQTGFPVLRKLVGDRFFHALAGVYLRQHPPRSPLMMFYGGKMPDFLRGFAPAAAHPYLPDVAALELALRQAYHAADVPQIAADRLTMLSPVALMAAHLRFAPAVRLVRSPYPIHAIYRANTVEGAPPPVMQAESVLITRREFDPEIHLLPAGSGALVLALLDGQTLGDAMQHAAGGGDLAALLQLLLAQGAITDIY